MSSSLAPPRPAPVQEALERFVAGEAVLVAGYAGANAALALSAASLTVRGLQMLHERSGGLVVLGCDERVAKRLDLAALPVSARRAAGLRLALPIDARDCRRGGWSLSERVHTIRVAVDPAVTPADVTVPGHVHAGLIGSASLSAPTAALELARAAGEDGAVLLGTLADRAGRPLSAEEAAVDERLRALPAVCVEELWCGAASDRAAQASACQLPTRLGDFEASAAVTGEDGETVVTLVHGDSSTREHPLTITHTACLLGDTFGSLLCDCRERLHAACEQIRAAGAGTLIYVRPAAGDGFTCPRSEAPR